MTPQGNHIGMRSVGVQYPMDEAYISAALALAPWIALAHAVLGDEELPGDILTAVREARDIEKGDVPHRMAIGPGSHDRGTASYHFKWRRKNTSYVPKVKRERVNPQEALLSLIAAIENDPLALGIRGFDPPRSAPEGPAAA